MIILPPIISPAAAGSEKQKSDFVVGRSANATLEIIVLLLQLFRIVTGFAKQKCHRMRDLVLNHRFMAKASINDYMVEFGLVF